MHILHNCSYPATEFKVKYSFSVQNNFDNYSLTFQHHILISNCRTQIHGPLLVLNCRVSCLFSYCFDRIHLFHILHMDCRVIGVHEELLVDKF